MKVRANSPNLEVSGWNIPILIHPTYKIKTPGCHPENHWSHLPFQSCEVKKAAAYSSRYYAKKVLEAGLSNMNVKILPSLAECYTFY